MKLTKKYLKKIIKEELEKAIGDFGYDEGDDEGDDERLPPEFYEKVKELVSREKKKRKRKKGNQSNYYDVQSIYDKLQGTKWYEASSNDIKDAIEEAEKELKREEEEKELEERRLRRSGTR